MRPVIDNAYLAAAAKAFNNISTHSIFITSMWKKKYLLHKCNLCYLKSDLVSISTLGPGLGRKGKGRSIICTRWCPSFAAIAHYYYVSTLQVHNPHLQRLSHLPSPSSSSSYS